MRPVVVLGALGDLIRLKLLEEMPDRFDVPSKISLIVFVVILVSDPDKCCLYFTMGRKIFDLAMYSCKASTEL